MGGIFPFDGPIEFDPPGDWTTTDDERKDAALLLRGREWDGRGTPPSRAAAIGYVMAKTGDNRDEVIRKLGTKGTLTSVGQKVRAYMVENQRGKDRITERDAAQRRRKALEAKQKPAELDADGDGKITEQEAAGAAGVTDQELGDILAGGPGAGDIVDPRGAPLWPYEGSPEQLAALDVENNSTQGVRENRFGGFGGQVKIPKRTGARYFEQDTLDPLKWSAEQRADLQRVMQGIGLYGDKSVRLGSWTAADQAIYAEVLAASNVEGLTWNEMLAVWRRNPPADLLDAASGGAKRAPLVVQHTNPLDIRQTAQDVSRSLTGEVDPNFSASTVNPYQGMEAAAQTAGYNADEAGGTVTQAPSVSAFVEDKLRRENPIEVDGYQFLSQFEQMLSMLGVG